MQTRQEVYQLLKFCHAQEDLNYTLNYISSTVEAIYGRTKQNSDYTGDECESICCVAPKFLCSLVTELCCNKHVIY